MQLGPQLRVLSIQRKAPGSYSSEVDSIGGVSVSRGWKTPYSWIGGPHGNGIVCSISVHYRNLWAHLTLLMDDMDGIAVFTATTGLGRNRSLPSNADKPGVTGAPCGPHFFNPCA